MRGCVVIPTYDRPDRLWETVRSVCDQSVGGYEVVVVDDGSESTAQDQMLRRAEEAYDRITVLRQENGGPAAARNRGWRHTDAEVVLFTDDDCIVPHDWVEGLTEAFEPGVGAVGGTLEPSDEAVESNAFARFHRYRNEGIYDRPDGPTVGGADLPMGGTANIAYRREALEEVEGFDETFPTAAGEDADLQKRVVDAGWRMKFVPVAVEHNDTYDWRSFVSRAVRRGSGTYHYHRRHGPSRSVARALLGLAGAPLAFLPAIRRTGDSTTATLAVVEHALTRYGEVRTAVMT